jgi:uncharacterized protein (TIGR03435 family)
MIRKICAEMTGRTLRYGLASLLAIGATTLGLATSIEGESQEPSVRPRSAVDSPRQIIADGKMAFEVASVRIMQDREKLPMAQQMFYMSPPGAGEFTMRNARLDNLIAWAFQVGGLAHPITREPAWMDSTYYEVAAKPTGDVGLNYDQLRPMVQDLLKERFHLTYHTESKSEKGYALVIAKGGSKLTPAKDAAQHAYMMTGRLDAANAPLSLVAELLAHAVGQAVVDETELKGSYDMKLNYAPMEATESSLPSIFAAVEEQLGLKLVSQKVLVEMFVIDHVDKEPTEN